MTKPAGCGRERLPFRTSRVQPTPDQTGENARQRNELAFDDNDGIEIIDGAVASTLDPIHLVGETIPSHDLANYLANFLSCHMYHRHAQCFACVRQRHNTRSDARMRAASHPDGTNFRSPPGGREGSPERPRFMLERAPGQHRPRKTAPVDVSNSPIKPFAFLFPLHVSDLIPGEGIRLIEDREVVLIPHVGMGA